MSTCDHTVMSFYDGLHQQSELNGWLGSEAFDFLISCTDEEAGNSRFKFCSECGKKIEWDKIREELNLKKNE